MSEEMHDFRSETKKYAMVFLGLLILTAVTVAVSGLKIGVTLGIILALVIATVKGSMVACNFMHLASEKRTIHLVLIVTAVFLIAMIILICMSHFSVPEGLKYVS